AADADFDAAILRAVEQVNNNQKQTLHRKLRSHLGSLQGKTIAIWGLAFKPRTDDMREAPSRNLIEAIWAEGGKVRAYDPVAMDETRKIYGERPDLVLVDSPMAAAEGADALAVVTEWRVFQSPNLGKLRQLLKRPLIVDGRNMYDPEWVRGEGFVYDCVGRPARRP
ncbi:MAG TPA: UDP binding domain-containing protein, partial [Nevskia sp.]|nr:UDP binding domain-containing protein [Nevskia sp.]